MAKRKRKKILFILFSSVLLLLLIVATFIYFRVDNSVTWKAPPSSFKNKNTLSRIDGTSITADSLTGYINTLITKVKVHGLAVSIINNNQLVYQNYFGFRNAKKSEPLTPGVLFYGASLSKTIFADVVMQLVEENRINLDAPLYKYLKQPLYTYKTNSFQRFFGTNYFDYEDLKNDERYKLITARMCLSHTTGLPNWRWLEEDKKLKIKFAPGTRYNYSVEGMFLLQFVIE